LSVEEKSFTSEGARQEKLNIDAKPAPADNHDASYSQNKNIQAHGGVIMRRFFNVLALTAALVSSNQIKAGDYFSGTDPVTTADLQTPATSKAAESNVLSASALEPANCCDEGLVSGGCRQGLAIGSNSRLSNLRCNSVGIFGFDSYKGLGDSVVPAIGGAPGFMNNAGILAGLNTGFGLGNSRIRGQIGGTMGVYDLKGRDTVNPTTSETQGFLTGGVYKRSNYCAGDRTSWGLVYDQFWGSQWGLNANEIYLGQFRSIMGYALDANNEIGTWATIHTNTDTMFQGGGPAVTVRASNQLNVYLKHRYAFGGTTTAYAGAVDAADIGSWQMGLLGAAPLNRNTSLYGNSTFAFPGSASGTVGSNELFWNLSAGLMFTFGKAQSSNISGQACLPLQNIANNGNFLITN
jgi:hypothetical protein